MQAGEKRFARRLVSHLEDDYLCWYEMPVGKRRKYTDFIVLHPARGLLLLEVKDWKLETIQRMDRVSATLMTADGIRTVANPLEQARQCAYLLVNRLRCDPQLVHADGPHRGQPVFPYGYGVVLSNITRRQFDATDLGEVLPPHQVICRDEMLESVDAEAFQERMWDMFNFRFPVPLTLPQLDRIRWHLFPEIRIDSSRQADLFAADAEEDAPGLAPDIVKVMDMQQELLARSLGEGHRVIHGVAGSGKTLILGYRCLHLAQALNKPILVLCYNITLAARLRALIVGHGIAGRVNVYHFHDWCGEQLRAYHVARPAPGEGYVERLVGAVIDGVAAGTIPAGQYGAVMIDEGHDFEADWLRLVVRMVDPESNNLLLLYDDAQSIYGGKAKLDFSLSSVGIEARGRTTVLKLNYRNTDEILAFAYQFARDYLPPGDTDTDGPPLLEPEAVGRHGPAPRFKLLPDAHAEARYVAVVLRHLYERRGVPWADMCVTYRAYPTGRLLAEAFAEAGIPCHWLGSAAAKKNFKLDQESVKLMTMHSSKGLEFPVVAVAGLGHMPVEDRDPVAEAKLAYVAMTRSTEKLLVTAHRRSAFVQRLEALPGGDRETGIEHGVDPSPARGS